LKCLEGSGRDEAIDAHRSPTDRAEALVHLPDAGDALGGDSAFGEPAHVGGMGRMLQARVELEQDEAPDRLIDGRVTARILLDDEGLQVVRNRASARVDARRRKRGAHLGILAQSQLNAGCPPEQSRRLGALRQFAAKEG
jgi:hypothetical protein